MSYAKVIYRLSRFVACLGCNIFFISDLLARLKPFNSIQLVRVGIYSYIVKFRDIQAVLFVNSCRKMGGCNRYELLQPFAERLEGCFGNCCIEPYW